MAAAERGFPVRCSLSAHLVNERVEAVDDRQLTETIIRRTAIGFMQG
jgi:hypothetical protein